MIPREKGKINGKVEKKPKIRYYKKRSEITENSASLAQLVEQRIYTAKVGGSNPSGCTKRTAIRRFLRILRKMNYFILRRDLKVGAMHAPGRRDGVAENFYRNKNLSVTNSARQLLVLQS